MSKYIRVPLTEAMEKDYKECADDDSGAGRAD